MWSPFWGSFVQRTRLLIVVLTCLGWAAWLLCAWATRIADEPPALLLLARDVTQMTAGMLSVAAMLVFLVCPAMLTAMVWRDVGRREHQDTCHEAIDAKVIPIRPIRLDS